MLRSRLIPTLLVDQGRLVKTVRFKDPTYLGDPLNTVRIFNEKRVDELFVADISASPTGRGPDFELLEKLAGESRMPVTYAGGVSTVEEVSRLVSIGIEKVAIGSASLDGLGLVDKASQTVGRQSVVVIINSVVVNGHQPTAHLYNPVSRKPTTMNVSEFAARAEAEGAGELVLYSVDRDGSYRGYDFDLIQTIRNTVDIPITLVGGASSDDDIRTLARDFGPVGIGVGSLFVFTGKFRSVLIQYPSHEKKLELCVAPGALGAPIGRT